MSKRPLFDWKDRTGVSSQDAYTRRTAPRGQLALTGPSPGPGNGPLPVRGDLAHVRLAGRYFVPHYAVAMPFRVGQVRAVLRAAADAGSDELAVLEPGTTFDVLDIAGGWCWGEQGEGGPVGYVEQASLEAPGP